eukprot:m.472123 g.472123  ORF g.472123 m.472123 type:complete len:212 (-) comp21660_c0_seq12:296-931(-)
MSCFTLASATIVSAKLSVQSASAASAQSTTHDACQVKVITPSVFTKSIRPGNAGMGDTTWFVVFSCPNWCQPCQMYQSTLKMIAYATRGDDVRVGHMDCDNHRDFCNNQGIQEYPTIKLYNTKHGPSPIDLADRHWSVDDTSQWIRDNALVIKPDEGLVSELLAFYTTRGVPKTRAEIARIVARFKNSRSAISEKLQEKYNEGLVLEHNEL